MKKKLLSMILCMSMICSSATVVLADGEVTYPTDQTANLGDTVGVNITAIAGDKTGETEPDVYSVEIVWGNMEFAWGYSATTVNVWDPTTHGYTEKTAAAAAEEGLIEKEWHMVKTESITYTNSDKIGLTTQDALLVFNHSNKPVDATVTVDDTADTISDAGIDATFTCTSKSEDLQKGTAGLYKLNRGIEGVTHADNGSSVMGQITLDTPDDPSKLSTTKAVVAKLNVKISKPTDDATATN